MPKITIDLNRCDNSPFCPVRRVCPKDAVTAVTGGYAIDPDKCSECGSCVRTCPMGAVSAS